MSLLPFDPMSPRALSVVLLGLIVLLTHAESPGAMASSLVSNDGGGYSVCGSAYVPSSGGSGWGCDTSRNSIRAGNLTVGKSF